MKAAEQQENTRCFRIQAVDGKGLGVIAERQLQPGDLIVSETPVFKYQGGDPNWKTQLQEQFDALSVSEQESVLTLHDAFARAPEEKSLAGILRTNCFMEGVGSVNGVLCPIAGRFNHSCVPNCEQSWDDTTGMLHIYAGRQIEPGTELCVHYIDVQDTLTMRHKLLEPYSFVCRCAACSDSSGESDRRRQRLKELIPEVAEVGASDPDQALQLVNEVLALYDAEDIHINSLRKFACFYAFQLALCLRDRPQATRWIQWAYGYSRYCHGSVHAETLKMLGYVQDPLSHPAACSFFDEEDKGDLQVDL